MTFQLPNLRPILRPVAALSLLAVIALAPTPVSLSGVALAQTPAPTNFASPTSPPTAVASSSNDATLHKVHIGGDGFSIINPGPGEEASGNIAFDKDNEATVELDSYLTSSSICAWPTQPQASVAIDREDSLPGITFDQSLHSSKGCASPVDLDVQTGSNDVTITVTAPDSVTIIRYLITIVVPERPAAPAPETWAQDQVTREHTFITPYTNEALATGFTSANGSADRFWIASIRVEEELARLARVVVSIYDRETGEVDRGAGFNIGPCNGVPSTFKICEYGSFANPELWYGNGILWLTVEKHDSGHGNRHYLYAFQRTGSSWKLLSDKTIRLTHYDHISAGRDHPSGGIWSDGETMWVTGHHLRVYAYNMTTGERDRSEEFSVPGTTAKPPFLPYSVGSPAGLWSNGKTMWVEGAKRRVVYAFDLQTKARVPSRDFDIVRAPPPPSPYDLLKMTTSGMWSDGSIIWVRQGLFNVAYDLPGTPPQFAALYAVEMASDSSDVPNLITVVAADADNDSITYAKAGDWPAQFGIDSTSGVISYTRGIGASVAPGEYELTVTADDGIDGTAETTVVVSVSGNSGICDRTQQVRDGILALLRNVGDCELVTSSDLAGITGDLLLSDAGIAVLHDGDFSGLTSLQGLHMWNNDLTSLPEDVFDGLASLQQLILFSNQLASLPDGVFDGLSSLKVLDLDNNDLTSLPEDVFDGLTSLRRLGLGSNRLASLPNGVFDNLTILERLTLYDNSLSELPADVFDGLTSLQLLSLDSNDLTSLPEDVFDGLTSLRRLGLGSNQLASLPNGVFDGLTSLQRLYLYDNNLSELPAGVFDGLSNLQLLRLDENNLSELPDGLFEGLSNLDRLSLTGNPGAPFTLTAELERRGDGAVAVKVAEGSPFDMDVGLSVEGGTLSSAAIEVEGGKTASDAITFTPVGNGQAQIVISVESAEFDEDDYEYYSGIRIGVGDSLTPTSGTPGTPLAVSGTTTADYAENGAEAVAAYAATGGEDNATVAWSLSGDDGGDFSISIAGELAFTAAPDYENPADADADNVYSVTVQAFDGTNTGALDVTVTVTDMAGICGRTEQVRDGILALLPNVSDCELVTAEDLAGITGSLLLINKGITGLKSGDFQGLANLQALHLERNSLTALPTDVFDGLASLNTLHLEHNSLTALPTDMFTHLRALKLLHLGENEFTALPADTFADAASLERLIMDNNHLLSLPEGVFDGLSKLKSLDLHHNKNVDESKALSALPDGVLDDLVELEALLLHDNALTTLPGFERLGKLEELRLHDNALATLPEDAFNGLGKLEDLSLENNKLTALPTDVFAGLVKLKDLSLENNNLRTLPAGAFAGLSSLESLYLYGNKLNALPGDVFEGLGALRVLALFDNKLRDLPDGLFEGLSSLNTVWFIANTGAPFTLTPVLKQDRSTYEIAVRVAQGAPADMTIALSVSNGGVLSQHTVTIAAGSLASEGVTLSRSGTFSRVFTVSVDSAAFVDGGRDENGKERIDGFEIGQANPLSANLAPGQRGEEEEPAESGPAAVIALSPPTAPVGAPIDVTMTFSNLESDSNTSDTDYIFRADVVGADQCENRAGGYGLGVDRYMYQVDEDPEVRTGTISADCPAGAYTVQASISSPDNVELASASADFSVVEPGPPLSNDATLSSLTLSGVDFGAFDPAATGYTAEVANGVAETAVTPTTNHDGATHAIKLDGAADEDGTVSLAVGSNAIAIKVTAEDGNTTRTYTVTVTRAAPPLSADTTLSNLALSGIDFGAFDEATTRYSASVANDVAETTVTPTMSDDGAAYAIKLDGLADADGVFPLAVGTNVITVEVTAEDGSAVKTYKVTVTRAALTVSGPAVAIALSPSGPVDEGVEVTVTMSFANLASDSDTSDTDYIFRADVRNADGCEGGGMGNDRYMYKVDEDPEVRTGTISTSCAPGDYTVEVSISSPGNVKLASATAGFTVNAPDQQQPEPASTDATLSGLTLSDVTLAFASDMTRYTANVASDMDETTVTPTTNDDGATYVIKLDGVADSDGVILLALGGNVITIEVTAEDGNAARTYTVTVTRAAPLSTDATLSDLALSGVDIGTFDPATTEYAASVGNEVEQTTVTATANDGGAAYAVKLDGVADADGVIPLDVGGNVITIEVTAEDGNTAKTYTVTVTRTALPPAVAPDSPDAPTGSLDGAGNASLDWNDVETATGYEVGLWWNGEWTTLPNDGAGLGVSISGSGATVTGLPTYWTVYYFRVRAVNEAGTSDWSPMSKLEL